MRTGAVALVSLSLLTACGRTTDMFSVAPLRQAEGVPARFELPADTLRGNACYSPMRDPRDGTEIRMERAQAPRADYAVPPGRYGVGPNELLRLDCRTGQALGIVPLR